MGPYSESGGKRGIPNYYSGSTVAKKSQGYGVYTDLFGL